jgi:hypothetical protein
VSASKLLVFCWLALVVLSIATVLLGSAGSTLLLSLGVLTAALAKAWIITDGFMELRHAPPLWRNLLLGWPLVMVAGILIAQML